MEFLLACTPGSLQTKSKYSNPANIARSERVQVIETEYKTGLDIENNTRVQV